MHAAPVAAAEQLLLQHLTCRGVLTDAMSLQA